MTTEKNSEGPGTPAIQLDQVIEGDTIGSRNYRFVKVGESVPIKPPGKDDSLYDSHNPPSKPLAVSERFRLLFIAHSNGFYVARTKEVMGLAEEIKDNGSSQSIDELSILILSIGRVSILALSSGDSLLAASVANQLHFFSISALLHKEQKPAFSVCLDDFSCIKDMKWARKAEKNYVVLSSDGKLHQGIGQGSPMNVMDNVDAVEWSPDGAFVAVARKNVLGIMSSQFTEKLSFSLSSTSIIVDSIRWLRTDSIVLGCLEGGDESEQGSYFIQVIATQSLEITDACSKPVVLSFSDAFLDYQDNVVPGATGPNLFVSYLDHQKLAFIANRKNLSQHIVILDWSQDGNKNEPAIVELLNDAWRAYIESQGNGDDNLILASYVDKVSQNHEIRCIVGEAETELSPCCILLCLTIDGKLSLFHFFSATGALGSPEVIADSDGKEDGYAVMLPEHGLSEISSEVREQNVQHVSLRLEPDDSGMVEPHTVDDVVTGNSKLSASWESKKPDKQSSFDNLEQKPPISFEKLNGDNEETFTIPMPNQDGGNQELLSAEKPGPKSEDLPSKTCHLEAPGIRDRDFCKTEAFSVAKPHVNSFSVSTDLSSQSISKNLQASGSLEFRENYVLTDLRTASPSFSIAKSTLLETSDEKSLLSSIGIIDKKSPGIPDRNTLHSTGCLFQSPPKSKETAAPAVTIDSSGQRPMAKMGDIGSVSAFGNSQVILQESFASGLSSVPRIYEEHLSASSQWPNNEQKLSKQICNVEVMARKMDSLLEAIGGAGGFRDASTTSQEDSVVALEEGLWTISERCRMWRGVLEERLREIQLLLDKTVQVSAKRICMQGIFQQATDKWYWDLWNCQKLSSELELKRKHIIEVDQDLTSQLVELERHFNTIEFNRFGKSEVAQTNPRAIQRSHGKSRQQSFYSLQNTMGAQLAAAEKLSECLRKQMAALNVQCPAKKQNLRRELFETLGLTYDGASYNSPSNQKASDTLTKQLLKTSCSSVSAKELSCRNQYTPVKASESESLRRRRDSLDQKWSSSEAPKTTLKRIIVQGEHENSSTNRLPSKAEEKHLKLHPPKGSAAAHSILSDSSATSTFQSKSPIVAEKHVKQSIEYSMAPSQSADALADPAMQVSREGSPAVWQLSASTASASLNGTRENHTSLWKSKSGLPLVRTSESLSGGDSRCIQQSKLPCFDAPSIPERLPGVSMTSSKNDVEIPNNEVPRKEVKNTLTTTKSSLSDSNSSYKASVSPAEPIALSPSFSQKSVDTEIAKSKSSPGETTLPSPASLTPQVNLSSTTSSSLSKASAATSSSAMLSGKFSPSEFRTETHQKASNLIVSSSLTSASSLPFSIPKLDGFSSTTLLFKNGNAGTLETGSQPLVSVFGSKRDGDSTKGTRLSNSSSAIGEAFELPVSVSQLGLANDTSNFGTERTTQSTQVTELPPSLKSENQPSISSMSDATTEMAPYGKLQQPWPSTTNSPAATVSGMPNDGKNGSSAVSDEDEMEEEAPEGSLTTELALGNLGGFGIGSTPNSTLVRPNLFGGEMLHKAATSPSSPFTLPTPSAELFRPASFNFQSPLYSQPSQSANIGAFSSAFDTGNTSQGATASGFGQPGQFGSGQQALGSVLGAFGQSRQLGASPPRSGIPPPSGLTGMSTGGFGGGFSSVASAGGGFASLATGGGFAAAAMTGGGGGFAAAATAGGGFAAAAPAGAGFASGGFGAFSTQGGGGFSTFATSSGAGRPPSELFTQMRK
ncbi:nuclear pore complex protein NUP214 [Coffea arabica]|uniref:Nuclear pore complex protein NUP214 n=1 Tax=Coffea arabica TaxID=13443 RepID=A0A6P6T2K7_COFAR